MPGGGLYSLVAYGGQNVLLSGNPDFTFFYKTYKKYTHYSEESVTQAMDGPQELNYFSPVQVRLKIQRVADLVRDMYLTFNLPDIYCKYIDEQQSGRDAQYNFKWTKYIGCNIIQNVAILIGGNKMQEFDGNYIIARAQADLTNEQFTKWERLVGNVPELYDPASGLDAGGSLREDYPLVFNDPLGGNINYPSIVGREITVPLPFWFTESTYNALPLIALQYHDVEVQVTLRPIQELYQVLDPSGNTVRPGFRVVSSASPDTPGGCVVPGTSTESLYNSYLNPAYSSVDIGEYMIQNFLTDWGQPVPQNATWELNPRIQATYVYLTGDERNTFASAPLQYLIRQVTTYPYEQITSRQYLQLYTHNPVNRLIINAQRSDSYTFRNDIANYTNWPNPQWRPYLAPVTPEPYPGAYSYSATGRILLGAQREILQSLTVLADGNELQEIKPIRYFEEVVPWKYLKGVPPENGIGPIIYPFSLNSPSIQPDGSINTSRVKLFQVDLNPYPLCPNSNYTYDVIIYVENMNWVVITSGCGSLKYAL